MPLRSPSIIVPFRAERATTGSISGMASAVSAPECAPPSASSSMTQNNAHGDRLTTAGTDMQAKIRYAWGKSSPGGETTSVGARAGKLGTRDARDVTEAIGSNTIAILIPCHRIIKKDGSISGYRWGVRRKRILLHRER